jgi:anaerobic magnesium-protoporphyrin IX monomethyl ester cyclase
MELLLINTPNRINPCTFPPYACLSLMKYLKKNGYSSDDLDFYNVDYYRPDNNDLLKIIKEKKPRVLGISAVVSTSYKFTKEITLLVKKELPETVIIVGGNLAASAEILIKKTGIDFCVLGEGETILLNFMNRLNEVGLDHSKFKDIKGLVFSDGQNGLINTGYGNDLPTEDLYDVDWTDLKETSPYFIYDVFNENSQVLNDYFITDKRVYEPHRRNKKFVTFIIGKGCVAKCTFCHRWDKGIRHIPIKILMERLDFLIEKYDVGFISPQIEAFGCDKNWLFELCDELKKRDILWYAQAVRAKTVSQEVVDKMNECGCTSIVYGLETGSPKMLEIMEKKTTLEENKKAQKLTIEKGYYSTVLQFVIGMPGESPQTIKESIEFAKYCMTLSKWTNPHNISINYAQALPGTPLYEFARKKGLIGTTIDGEEQYLLDISDKDASDLLSAINMTEYPTILYWSWRFELYLETLNAYITKYGMDQYYLITAFSNSNIEGHSSGALIDELEIDDNKMPSLIELFISSQSNANIAIDSLEEKQDSFKLENFKTPSLFKLFFARDLKKLMIFHPIFLYRLRKILPLFLLVMKSKRLGFKLSVRYFKDYFYFLLFGRQDSSDIMTPKSLRVTVNKDLPAIETDMVEMHPLRQGRW